MNTEITHRQDVQQPAHSSSLIATRATGRATIGLNISFVLLPETPMLARYFDPRVGYFSDDSPTSNSRWSRAASSRAGALSRKTRPTWRK